MIKENLEKLMQIIILLIYITAEAWDKRYVWSHDQPIDYKMC